MGPGRRRDTGDQEAVCPVITKTEDTASRAKCQSRLAGIQHEVYTHLLGKPIVEQEMPHPLGVLLHVLPGKLLKSESQEMAKPGQHSEDWILESKPQATRTVAPVWCAEVIIWS